MHKGLHHDDGPTPSTKNVQWCEGSGRLPSPDPENMINPWDPFIKRSSAT